MSQSSKFSKLSDAAAELLRKMSPADESHSRPISGEDLELVKTLEYDPNLEPDYCFMRDCLVWPDERPEILKPFAYERLDELWIARGFLHRENWAQCPDSYKTAWQTEIDAGLPWPGFKRLKLSKADINYFVSARTNTEKNW